MTDTKKLEKLIKFLKENSIEELQQAYAIQVKQHGKYPNLYLLKYHQIDTPLGKPMCQVCRGIILDKDNGWKPVSFPYSKFWNYHEKKGTPLNWRSKTKVYEKLDGSLITLYWYGNEWNISTSGVPDAECCVNTIPSLTFNKLFWSVWNELGYDFPQDKTKCYMFELMTKYNRIVVHHPKDRIVLHGARDLTNLKEVAPEDVCKNYNWECVKTFSLGSIEEIIASSKNIDPMNQEGYIVVDSKFNRVKVKSPQYVALHHVSSTMSSRAMLEIIRTNETSEFLAHFPEWIPLYNHVKEKYDTLVEKINGTYLAHKDIKDQKQFALKVKDLPYSGVLFALRSGRTKSVKEYLSNMKIKNLESILKIKEAAEKLFV